MNINLSETEIRALLVALEHTQNFQQSDAALDEDRFRTENAPGTAGWLQRKDAAAKLSEKLTGALDAKAKAERMMKGTASPTIENLCGNDPVNW